MTELVRLWCQLLTDNSLDLPLQRLSRHLLLLSELDLSRSSSLVLSNTKDLPCLGTRIFSSAQAKPLNAIKDELILTLLDEISSQVLFV